MYITEVSLSSCLRRRIRSFWLYEIKDVRVEEARDPLGGSEYEMILFMRSGEKIKAISGHLVAADGQIKYKACEELKQFLSNIDYDVQRENEAEESRLPNLLKKFKKLKKNESS